MSDYPRFRYIHYEHASGAVRCLDCKTEFERTRDGHWVPQCECSHAEQMKSQKTVHGEHGGQMARKSIR